MQVPSFGVYDRSAQTWVSSDSSPLAYPLPRARQAARLINKLTQSDKRFACRELPPGPELDAALAAARAENIEDGLT